MEQYYRPVSFVLLLILLFSSLVMPASAQDQDNAIQPYLHVTSCPSCDSDDFRSVGPVSYSYYDTPTRCDLHAGLVDETHQHEFTEEYTLYRCYTCGYEKKFDYILREYCPVMGSHIGWSLK